MAHNGGNCPLPSHRLGQLQPVQTARLLPRNANILLPQTSSSLVLSPPSRPTNINIISIANSESRNIITLDQPRPGVARVRNEYIETPLRTPLPSLAQNVSNKGSNSIKRDNFSPLVDDGSSRSGISLAEVHGSSVRDHYYHRPHNQRQPPVNHLLLQPSPPHEDGRLQTVQTPKASQRFNQHNTQVLVSTKPVVSQPCSTLKKQNSLTSTKRNIQVSECNEELTLNSDVHRDSIICPKCGRCRCDACKSTRPLPSTWICSDSYQCSFETTLDQCTCMCCVKALFYHCCKDYETDDVSCADKPCSCSPHHRWMRWGSLCVLTAILPCLLCYWPMKLCLKLCEACHTRFRHQGCRCSNTSMSASKLQITTPSNSSDDDFNPTFTRKINSNTPHAKRLLDPTV